MPQALRTDHIPSVQDRHLYQNRRISDYVSVLQWHMLQASQPSPQRQRGRQLATHETQHSRYLSPLPTIREV